MGSRKKVLFVIPSLVGGGAEKALITLLNHLSRDKYEIDLCVVEKKGIYLSQVPDFVNILHLFTNKFVTKAIVELHRRFNISWPFKWAVQRTIKSEYDIGISFLDSVFSDILLFLADCIERKAVVLHSSYKSNNNWSKFINGEYETKLKRRYRQVDTIISVSQDAIDEFISVLGKYDDLRVINNPINRDEVLKKSGAFDTDFKKGRINIIAVGNLLPVKGYKNLLEACALLKKSGNEFKLRILGKGPLEDILKEQIAIMDLKDCVSLLGFRNNPYPYMANSDIFVMSSFSEALPTVLCEAMILGRPVVVTNCSGCRSIVDKGVYGIMSKPTPQSLFEGLKLMIDDPALRKEYCQKSQERSQLFNINNAVFEYEKLLDQLC